MKNKISIFISAMLLQVSINAFSQDVNNSATPEFELIYAPSASLDSLYEFNQVWETKSGDFLINFSMVSNNDKTQDRQKSAKYSAEYPYGLVKVTKDGSPEKCLFLNDKDRFYGRIEFLETQSHGSFVIETAQMKESDLGMIRIYNVNDELEILSTRQHFKTIDTLTDYVGMNSNRFFVFDVFESKDCTDNYDGMWVCVFKRAHYNYPDEWNCDSLFFFKLDYEGNMIDTKYHRLHGINNNSAFTSNNIVSATRNGYSIISGAKNSVSGGGLFTWFDFDRDFNFVNQYTQDPSTRQYEFKEGNATTKRLSTGEAYISAETDLLGLNTNRHAAIALVDTTFTVKKIAKYSFNNNISHMKLPVVYGSVSFIDEDRIFWGFNDDVDFGAYPYYNDDTWVNLFFLTPDLKVEQEFFYAIKGQKNYTYGIELKATRDGGMVLIGDYCNIKNQPERADSFITKFPRQAFSIEEAHNHGLKLAVAYPNPGHAALNIRTALQDATVEVYDVQGRKVAEQAIGGIITTLDTESWPSGMYLWNVLQDGKVSESGKWVKE